MSPELVDKLLVEVLLYLTNKQLNLIWREREKRQITRIRNKANTEVMNMKRQMVMRHPHDEIQAQKHISRLKSDLKTAHKEVRQNAALIERNRK